MSNFPPLPSVPKGSPAVTGGSTDRARVSSEQILRGARTAEIDHEGQVYLLRVTRENKLILTK